MNLAGSRDVSSVRGVSSALLLVTGLFFPSPRSYLNFLGGAVSCFSYFIVVAALDWLFSSGCVRGNSLVRFVGRSKGATSGGVAVAEDLNASMNTDGIDARMIASNSIILRVLFINGCFILLFSVSYSASYEIMLMEIISFRSIIGYFRSSEF